MSASPAPTKGERTSQAILDTAYSLFIEQGFHATSMRQIAQSAGLALGSIYNHFESKEQIFHRVLLEKHPYQQVLTILQDTPGETVSELVHNAAHAIVAELGRRPDFLKLAFIEFSEFKGVHSPHIFQTIVPQFMPLLQRFKGVRKQLRELPAQVIIFAFLGVFFSYYLTETVIKPGSTPGPNPDTLEQFLEVFLHGIVIDAEGIPGGEIPPSHPRPQPGSAF